MHAFAQALPNGAILDINNGNAANSASYTTPAQSNYSVSFTATTTGINYVLFAFRQDPAFWTFQDPELFVAGTPANLLTYSTFTTGGAIPNSSIQAPANWGVVYQTGSPPQAAGTWHAPASAGGNGTWYDGAVGSFDGIYQGVLLTSGVAYTLTFSLKGDNSANSNDIRVGAFTGLCVSLSGPASSCALPTSSVRIPVIVTAHSG